MDEQQINNLINKSDTNDQREEIVLGKASELLGGKEFVKLYGLIGGLQSTIWGDLSTARYTKMLRIIINMMNVDDVTSYEGISSFLNNLIKKEEKRTLIKLELKCKLVYLHLVVGNYKECLDLIKELLPSLKSYDDKVNTIKIYLYESQANYELLNYQNAKASLTAARALAVSAVIPQTIQSEIDVLNGMYLTDDKCYSTAINYFLESLQGRMESTKRSGKPQFNKYNGCINGLRYIILCKILMNDVAGIENYLEKLLKNKKDLRSDEKINILLEIAIATSNRDINEYKKILNDNPLIFTDSFLIKHLKRYYDYLLNQNILKIVEPYSQVKIDFIANKLKYDTGAIEERLRLMILDKELFGILDHSSQCLINTKIHTSMSVDKNRQDYDEEEGSKNYRNINRFFNVINK